MKEHSLYSFYFKYLNCQLNQSKISKGQFALLKISSSKFEDFTMKFESDELFKNKVIKICMAESRDKKIDDIFDEFD